MAVLRQLHLSLSVLRELDSLGTGDGRKSKSEADGDRTTEHGQESSEGEDEDDIFIADQVPACLPVLKTTGPGARSTRKGKQRILFYCHFPDQLLSRRDEGGSALRLLKGLYRYPFDWFEGWAVSASDKVVANSLFTRGVVRNVFGSDRLGDVKVIYPCVDTEAGPSSVAAKQGEVRTEALGSGARESLWNGSKKILLSINRFERKKDMGLAVRAFYGLGDEGRKGTRLVIAGMHFPNSLYIYMKSAFN